MTKRDKSSSLCQYSRIYREYATGRVVERMRAFNHVTDFFAFMGMEADCLSMQRWADDLSFDSPTQEM